MDNNDVNNREGYLYLLGSRGYSAYEVAVQNGFVGTEEEWLASLKGDKGDTGNIFDDLTPEQKAEIKGDTGKSAYDIAVEHGFIGTEQDWVNAYLSPDGYVRNADVVDNLESTETQKPLSANQGRELKEDIDDINETVRFLFPKFSPNTFSGDSNLIKYGDINILIDCDNTTKWTYVKEFLDDNDATHIDYFILSHYDVDHYGNINNLITNGYLDSDTEVFLPIVPDNFSSMQTAETNVKTSLTNANISFRTPTEKETITIGESLKITFGNVNKSYMESNYTEYNATSLVCLIEHKDIKAFYSGDAFQQTFKYLYDINFIDTTIDLYKQAHHGIDTWNNFLLLDEIMSPRHTVQCGGIKDFVKNNFLCEETSFLINQGTLYYPCYIQNDYIKFVSNGVSLNCLSGKTSSFSAQNISTNIYVDIEASVNSIQDGTQTHPFSELMQAVGYIQNLPAGDYTINLADGNYGYSHEGGSTHAKNIIKLNPNNNIKIIIKGNSTDRTAVMLHHIRCVNSYVTLQDLSIDLKDSDAIGLDNSTLYAKNILVTSLDGEQTAHTGIMMLYNSKAYIENSKIEYANRGIRVQQFSSIGYSNIEFANITYENISVVNGIGTSKNILPNGSSDSTITLTDSYKQFDYIIIKYRTNDGIGQSITIPKPTDDYRVGLMVPYINNSGVAYHKSCILQLKNGNQLVLSNQYQTTIDNGSVSIASQTNVFTIQEVWAGYNV